MFGGHQIGSDFGGLRVWHKVSDYRHVGVYLRICHVLAAGTER